MNDTAVSILLKQLHTTLEGAPSISETDRELLRQLSVDIQALLARPGALADQGGPSVVDRLQTAITRLEVSHPDLTATLAQVSKTLGDMGI